MVDFQKLIKAWLFDYRKNRAIKKAQKLATLNRRKYLVLVSAGKPVVVSMQGVRKLIRQHRFTKGFTAEKAREIAIFEALPKPTA
jgi:ribosomal protein L15E